MNIRNIVIEVELISLKARRDAARNYPRNNDLQREADLLQKQIAALQEELNRCPQDNQRATGPR